MVVNVLLVLRTLKSCGVLQNSIITYRKNLKGSNINVKFLHVERFYKLA